MTVEKILGNIMENDTGKRKVEVSFEWFELEKKRISKTAQNGKKIGIMVSDMLRDGDILAEETDVVYVVKVLPCHLIKIYVMDMREMGRLCFELGNRHLTLRIEEQEVWVPFDAPTFAYLLKMGFDAEEAVGQFTDYMVCKAHGHENGHKHEH